ncbi:hypothetical protein AAF712_001544 [Marasmius tenuissimus]|uniref:Uncharacterized protein n=1 Tax=Marasmius tenuissimus TaxID=585030 RepID=A0ABR3ACL4_9AGAR
MGSTSPEVEDQAPTKRVKRQESHSSGQCLFRSPSHQPEDHIAVAEDKKSESLPGALPTPGNHPTRRAPPRPPLVPSAPSSTRGCFSFTCRKGSLRACPTALGKTQLLPGFPSSVAPSLRSPPEQGSAVPANMWRGAEFLASPADGALASTNAPSGISSHFTSPRLSHSGTRPPVEPDDLEASPCLPQASAPVPASPTTLLISEIEGPVDDISAPSHLSNSRRILPLRSEVATSIRADLEISGLAPPLLPSKPPSVGNEPPLGYQSPSIPDPVLSPPFVSLERQSMSPQTSPTLQTTQEATKGHSSSAVSTLSVHRLTEAFPATHSAPCDPDDLSGDSGSDGGSYEVATSDRSMQSYSRLASSSGFYSSDSLHGVSGSDGGNHRATSNRSIQSSRLLGSPPDPCNYDNFSNDSGPCSVQSPMRLGSRSDSLKSDGPIASNSNLPSYSNPGDRNTLHFSSRSDSPKSSVSMSSASQYSQSQLSTSAGFRSSRSPSCMSTNSNHSESPHLQRRDFDNVDDEVSFADIEDEDASEAGDEFDDEGSRAGSFTDSLCVTEDYYYSDGDSDVIGSDWAYDSDSGAESDSDCGSDGLNKMDVDAEDLPSPPNVNDERVSDVSGSGWAYDSNSDVGSDSDYGSTDGSDKMDVDVEDFPSPPNANDDRDWDMLGDEPFATRNGTSEPPWGNSAEVDEAISGEGKGKPEEYKAPPMDDRTKELWEEVERRGLVRAFNVPLIVLTQILNRSRMN